MGSRDEGLIGNESKQTVEMRNIYIHTQVNNAYTSYGHVKTYVTHIAIV